MQFRFVRGRNVAAPSLFFATAMRASTRYTFSPATSSGTSVPQSVAQEMRAKGFGNATPNFSADFSTVSDATNDLPTDIVTSPAKNMDFKRDMYGPWLVMTDDLQGELFMDHDGFVFYRPANGLGYGVGRVEVMDAAGTGTTFTIQLETYSYQQTSSKTPEKGISFDVTGMVNNVSSSASNYTTFSLAGVWRSRNPNDALGNGTAENVGGTRTTGQFNAAKLSPWSPAAHDAPWQPNGEIQRVFKEVFPQSLTLTSHIRRAEEAAVPSGEHQARRPPRHLDLSKYAVGNIPHVYYIPDYVSAEEEQQMLKQVQVTPSELKKKLHKRTVQEWGCTMCDECEKSFISDANMPQWVQQCTDMLTYDGIFSPSTFPNSVRIHEYEAGEGIGPHCDGPIYVPLVTVLSLASTSVMSFYPRKEPYSDKPMEHYSDTFKFADGSIGKDRPVQTVVMEPRSLLIFSSEVYYLYPHGISDQVVDNLSPEFAGEVVNRHLLHDKEITAVERKYRVSLTTRNLLTRCNHRPSHAEYNMKRAWYQYNQLPIPEPLFTPGPLPYGKTEAVTVTGTGEPSVCPAGGPLTDAQLKIWEAKLDTLFANQTTLTRAVNELKEIVMASLSAEVSYRKETSVVLNNLTTSILDVDAKLEDIVDGIARKGCR